MRPPQAALPILALTATAHAMPVPIPATIHSTFNSLTRLTSDTLHYANAAAAVGAAALKPLGHATGDCSSAKEKEQEKEDEEARLEYMKEYLRHVVAAVAEERCGDEACA